MLAGMQFFHYIFPNLNDTRFYKIFVWIRGKIFWLVDIQLYHWEAITS